MAENTQNDRNWFAQPSANNRSKLSNQRRVFPISARSALGRRLRDLADDYAARLGGWRTLSDVMVSNVRRAAELAALAEQSRAAALRDGNVDPVALARIDGCARRAERALGLPIGKPEPKPAVTYPSVAEVMARLRNV